MFRIAGSILLVLVATFVTASCSYGSYTVSELASMPPEKRVKEILRDPQLNDIYAANLKYFTLFSFKPEGVEESEESEKSNVYGLLKVVEVDADFIIVITEEYASEDLNIAINDLHGDFANISWSPDERITIQMQDLLDFKKTGAILDARRLSKEQIDALL